MVKFAEILKLSLTAIRANKMRSILTMLGVIIGVSSVILLTSIGNGLQGYINKQFESMGANVLIVMPGNVVTESGGMDFSAPPSFQSSKLTMDNVRDLDKLDKPLDGAAPIYEAPGKAVYQNKNVKINLIGTSENYAKIRSLKTEKGRGINASDIASARKVALIGPSLAEKLFGTSEPIGKIITLNERKFEVIGVTEKLGNMMGIDIDNAAYIPITTAQRVIGFENLMQIIVAVDSQENIDKGTQIIKNYFLKKITKDDFSVMDQKQMLNTITQILGVLTLALGGIAAISLVVGGIGIMNIMLVSVTERTKEIGLRKAVGATPRAILTQFLIEAIILSCGGGIIGILIGGSLSLLMSRFFPAAVTIWAVLLAFSVSALVGVVFGVAPALRASKLNPITALRYE